MDQLIANLCDVPEIPCIGGKYWKGRPTRRKKIITKPEIVTWCSRVSRSTEDTFDKYETPQLIKLLQVLCASRIQRWWRTNHRKYPNNHNCPLTQDYLHAPIFRRVAEDGKVWGYQLQELAEYFISRGKFECPATRAPFNEVEALRIDHELKRNDIESVRSVYSCMTDEVEFNRYELKRNIEREYEYESADFEVEVVETLVDLATPRDNLIYYVLNEFVFPSLQTQVLQLAFQNRSDTLDRLGRLSEQLKGDEYGPDNEGSEIIRQFVVKMINHVKEFVHRESILEDAINNAPQEVVSNITDAMRRQGSMDFVVDHVMDAIDDEATDSDYEPGDDEVLTNVAVEDILEELAMDESPLKSK